MASGIKNSAEFLAQFAGGKTDQAQVNRRLGL
jgi:hypothetical protein